MLEAEVGGVAVAADAVEQDVGLQHVAPPCVRQRTRGGLAVEPLDLRVAVVVQDHDAELAQLALEDRDDLAVEVGQQPVAGVDAA